MIESLTAVDALTSHVYDSAAVHSLIEDVPGDGFKNRYTSVSYGRGIDMRSVPTDPEVKHYDRLIATRVRMDRGAAAQLVNDSQTGRAIVAGFSVDYVLGEALAGFRPASSFMRYAQTSPFAASLWTREYVGGPKELLGETLSAASLWRIAERLSFLDEARWSGIPLRRHPEKLTDLDEWWPSPIQFGSRLDAGIVEVRIGRDILNIPDDQITFSGTLIRNGLIGASFAARGRGPHRINIDADGGELTLLVNGIPMDRWASFYIRSIGTNINISSSPPWIVQARGARPQMTLSGPSSMQGTVVAGAPQAFSAWREAWALGDRFRAPDFRDDGERVYDPTVDSKTVTAAFADLQSLGSEQNTRVIRVADPYALDEAAMEAIATTAARSNRVDRLEIYTMFSKPPTSHSSAPAGSAAALAIAEVFAKRYGIKVVCYRVSRLHDRFLCVGDRLWHVGPSFNKLGESMSAVVEMRDPRRIAQVIGFLDQAAANGALKVWETS